MNCNSKSNVLIIADQRNSTTILVPLFRKTDTGKTPLTNVSEVSLQLNTPAQTWNGIAGDEPGVWAITIPGNALRASVKKMAEATLRFVLDGQPFHQRIFLEIK